MDNTEWYIGALGALRRLPVPDPGIRMTPVLYGGIRQGLSGARTIDVTGVRMSYEFEFSALEPDEWMHLEALRTRLIPGPVRLLDPLRRNRLSSEAAAMRVVGTRYGGVTATAGLTERGAGFPVPLGVDHLVWSNRPEQSQLLFDTTRRTAVLPGETITGSVYVRSLPGVTSSVRLGFRHYQLDNSALAPVFTETPVPGEWTRLTITSTVPADAVTVELFLRGMDANTLSVAAPQIVPGVEPGVWEPGGGAPTVTVDSLTHVSPIYPISTVSMTLTEA
ncbi:hypothetical protein LX90_003764 [Lentzea flava]|nr:hypothetical protein [Lentzea flava]